MPNQPAIYRFQRPDPSQQFNETLSTVMAIKEAKEKYQEREREKEADTELKGILSQVRPDMPTEEYPKLMLSAVATGSKHVPTVIQALNATYDYKSRQEQTALAAMKQKQEQQKLAQSTTKEYIASLNVPDLETDEGATQAYYGLNKTLVDNGLSPRTESPEEGIRILRDYSKRLQPKITTVPPSSDTRVWQSPGGRPIVIPAAKPEPVRKPIEVQKGLNIIYLDPDTGQPIRGLGGPKFKPETGEAGGKKTAYEKKVALFYQFMTSEKDGDETARMAKAISMASERVEESPAAFAARVFLKQLDGGATEEDAKKQADQARKYYESLRKGTEKPAGTAGASGKKDWRNYR